MVSPTSFMKGGFFNFLKPFALAIVPREGCNVPVLPIAPPPPTQKVTVPTTPVELPKQPSTLNARIKQELDKLRIYAINSTMGNLILYTICGLKTDKEHPDLVTPLFHDKSKKQRQPVEFKKAIEDFIESREDISPARKIVAKLVCSLLYIITKAYLNSLFRALETTLLDFTALPPEKQVEKMYEMCLNPMTEYFQVVEYAYNDRAHQFKDLSQALVDRGYNPDFFANCLNMFVDRFLNSHVKTLGRRWTEKRVQEFNETDEKTSSVFQDIRNQALAGLSWVFGKVILEKVVSPVITFLLKETIKKIAFPMLLDSTQKSLGVGVKGAHALYNLKVSLRNMLEQFIKTASNPPNRIASAPPELSQELKTQGSLIFGKLLRALRLQMNDNNLQELRQFVSKPENPGMFQLDKYLKDYQPVIADILNASLAADGFVGETLFTSLQNLNVSCFTIPTTKPPMEDIDASLKDAIERTIPALLEKVSQALDPDTINQNAADMFILKFKQKVAKFKADCDASKGSSLGQFVTHFKSFKAEVEKLEKEAKNTMTSQAFEALQMHIQYDIAYIQRMESLSTNLEPLDKRYAQHQKELKQLELLRTLETELSKPSPTLLNLLDPLKQLVEITDGEERESFSACHDGLKHYCSLERIKKAKKQDHVDVLRFLQVLHSHVEKIPDLRDKTQTSSRTVLFYVTEFFQSIKILVEDAQAMQPITLKAPGWIESIEDSPSYRFLNNYALPLGFKIAPMVSDAKPRAKQYTEHLFQFMGKPHHYQGLVANILRGLAS